MRRIILLFATAAVMAVILVANALPASAAANEDNSSCRGDEVSDSVTDPLNPRGLFTGLFGFGKGTSDAAKVGNNYGKDVITPLAHGTPDFCQPPPV